MVHHTRSRSRLPYRRRIQSSTTRKAMAGSVVVPDLETTFTATSLPSQRARVSASAEGLRLFPRKSTSHPGRFGRKSSVALAPR